MNPDHHPDEDTLLALAVDSLMPGAQLVVRVHVQFCAHCRATMRFLNLLGGVLLDQTPPEPIAPHALDRALRALESQRPEFQAQTQPGAPNDIVMGLKYGQWSSFVPDVELAPVQGRFDPDETVCMLRGKAGALIPTHTHEQVERFVVLEGRFGLDQTVYRVGDYIEADSSVTHTPFIPRDGGCVCLFALQGGLVFPQSPGQTAGA